MSSRFAVLEYNVGMNSKLVNIVLLCMTGAILVLMVVMTWLTITVHKQQQEMGETIGSISSQVHGIYDNGLSSQSSSTVTPSQTKHFLCDSTVWINTNCKQ